MFQFQFNSASIAAISSRLRVFLGKDFEAPADFGLDFQRLGFNWVDNGEIISRKVGPLKLSVGSLAAEFF